MRHEDAAPGDSELALRDDPGTLAALLGRAHANDASPHTAAALEDDTRVIGPNPSRARGCFRRGNIDLPQQEFGRAIRDDAASLRLDPPQPAALLNRSIAAARFGRCGEAP